MVTPNADFANEIAKTGVMMCFQCGTCTAGCPSGRQTSYRTRKLMRMAQLGLKDEIINSDELWQCSTCYTCAERCPRQVPIVDIVIELRNIAVAEGHMRSQHKGTATNLAKYGHAVDAKDAIADVREQIGLARVPPTVLANPEAKAQLDKILELTGFNKIVE